MNLIDQPEISDKELEDFLASADESERTFFGTWSNNKELQKKVIRQYLSLPRQTRFERELGSSRDLGNWRDIKINV